MHGIFRDTGSEATPFAKGSLLDGSTSWIPGICSISYKITIGIGPSCSFKLHLCTKHIVKGPPGQYCESFAPLIPKIRTRNEHFASFSNETSAKECAPQPQLEILLYASIGNIVLTLLQWNAEMQLVSVYAAKVCWPKHESSIIVTLT